MNVLVIVFIIATIWLIRKLAWNVEEGTNEQREQNPELNTKNFDMHERRLEQFSKSKYKTVCSISGLMVLATIIQPLEEKSFADG